MSGLNWIEIKKDCSNLPGIGTWVLIRHNTSWLRYSALSVNNDGNWKPIIEAHVMADATHFAVINGPGKKKSSEDEG